MGLFGIDFSSKSTTKNTSLQQGVDGSGAIASDNASITYEFPDTVAAFAQSLAELAGSTVHAAVGLARGTQDTLGDIAEREKTPLTEWLPIAAVAAVGLVAIAFIFGGKRS